MKQVSHPLPRPEELGKEMDPGLFAIIERLARKRPIERFQSADEVREAIDDYLLSIGHASGISAGSPVRGSSASQMATRKDLQSPSSQTVGRTSRTPTSVRSIHSPAAGARPVPAEVVDELFDLFTEVLGPLARRLGERDAAAVGLDLEKLTTASWSDLINVLAARISDEAKHEAFVDRAILLRNKF